MSNFEPAPTYTDPVVIDQKKKPGQPGYSSFSPIWLKWFLDITAFISSFNTGGGSASIVHNQTQGLQGGTTNQFYHMTATEYAGNGTGAFARTTNAIFVTPTLGVAKCTSIQPAAAGYHASDGSAGITTTVTTSSLVGKTITIKDGIITGFA